MEDWKESWKPIRNLLILAVSMFAIGLIVRLDDLFFNKHIKEINVLPTATGYVTIKLYTDNTIDRDTLFFENKDPIYSASKSSLDSICICYQKHPLTCLLPHVVDYETLKQQTIGFNLEQRCEYENLLVGKYLDTLIQISVSIQNNKFSNEKEGTR